MFNTIVIRTVISLLILLTVLIAPNSSNQNSNIHFSSPSKLETPITPTTTIIPAQMQEILATSTIRPTQEAPQLPFIEFRGTVINISDRTIKIQTSEGEASFTITNDKNIKKNDNKAKLEDIQVGDAIELRQNTAGDVIQLQAKSPAATIELPRSNISIPLILVLGLLGCILLILLLFIIRKSEKTPSEY